MRKGFTVIELVFVIVIIGILSSIALPKFKTTMDQAIISKGISTLSTVRTALAVESQRRTLTGDSTEITNLSAGGKVFDKFSSDQDNQSRDILMYPENSCTKVGCWSGSGRTYKFYLPDNKVCEFTLINDKLIGDCPELKS